MSCSEEYELKSKKGPFGRKVVDGAFKVMQTRMEAQSVPNLALLSYDLGRSIVRSVAVIPKHFLTPLILEERPPLPATAKRAGWVGCNILVDVIPQSGHVYLVKDSRPEPKNSVLDMWQKTAFLREKTTETRGWLVEVMSCIERIGQSEFTIDTVYQFENELGRKYPSNTNVRPKIRQQLQVLRDAGYLDFVSRGRYRLR